MFKILFLLTVFITVNNLSGEVVSVCVQIKVLRVKPNSFGQKSLLQSSHSKGHYLARSEGRRALVDVVLY